MTNELRERALLPRQADLTALFAAVREMHCISVVGVSNLGKSALLRSMTDASVQAQYLGEEAATYIFIYVDFNQMLEMSEQAYYELVMRCSLDALRRCQNVDEVSRRVEAAYTGLVAPASSFEIPLRFAQAMAAIGDLLPQRVIFLFDEDRRAAGRDWRSRFSELAGAQRQTLAWSHLHHRHKPAPGSDMPARADWKR